MTRTTHTYAILQISPEAYNEIRRYLKAYGYEHAFHEQDGKEVIDMHGIAVQERTGGKGPCSRRDG